MKFSKQFLILGCLLLITTYNVFVRFSLPIHFDEAISIRMASLYSVSEIINATSKDVHPPLYYFFLKLWGSLFGFSLSSVRLFSCILGIFCILKLQILAKAYLVNEETFEKTETINLTFFWLPLTFVTFNTVFLNHVTTARMYPLVLLLTVFSLDLFLKLIHSTHGLSKAKNSIFLLIVTLLGMYTHYCYTFIVFIQLVLVFFFLLFRRKNTIKISNLKNAGISLTLGVLGFLPWLSVFLKQVSEVKRDYWAPPFSFHEFAIQLQQLITPYVNEYHGISYPKFILALSIYCCSIVVCLMSVTKSDINRVLLCVVSCGSGLMVLVVSLISPDLNIFQFRMISCSFLILLFVLISSIPTNHKLSKVFTLFAVPLLVLNSLVDTYSLSSFRNSGIKNVRSIILSNMSGMDKIFTFNPHTYLTLDAVIDGEVDLKLVSSKHPLNHVHGGAFISDIERIDETELKSVSLETVWTITSSEYQWENNVSIPEKWKVIEEWVIPQMYFYQADLFLRKYRLREERE